jgi:protein-S-isoprenylcysteine O-methyltransferase Ste14
MDIPLAIYINMLLVLVWLGLLQLYLEATTERRWRCPEGVLRYVQYTLGAPALISLLVFLLDTDISTRVLMPVSRDVQVAGVAMFNFAAILILWAHLSLRRSWSAALETRVDHRLVDVGPYRWIRHPLYSGYFLVTGGLFFMTGNWLVAGSMCAYFLAVAARARKEEEMLLDRLGNTYSAYISRTSRFLPLSIWSRGG